MNYFAVVFLAVVACAYAGLIAAPATRVLRGPSSSATVIGPDGSSISSIAPGGTVVADVQPGLVAAPAVVAGAPAVVARSAVVAPAALASPGVVSASGLVARSSVLTGWGGTLIAGPAGTITTSESLAPAPLAAAWL
ncbi:uncharacterized protein LOC123011448 [Tribolium madens]|uniref:uncharacterized protein LOC123011448 n=1 Tax=Tribolium madens TaxID=41895 RepID=UPI001CF75C0A|nr:uncharacterized protein LOC123011448 [Tribolium madens]